MASKVQAEVAKVVVGREEETRLILECLLARGHVLLEGVPGISKTLLAKAFAKSLGMGFKRVQFTPDMLPLDIVGGFIYNQAERKFEFRRGPVFTNFLLADEINRAPPKVQSALLEAMQELQVTVDGHTEQLPRPVIVVGTENPLEFQGVYPLPEGQLDRFMMKLVFAYQSLGLETAVLRRNMSELDLTDVGPVLGIDDLQKAISAVGEVKATDDLVGYIARLGEAIRADQRVELGPSPRAMVQLLHCTRAKAWLEGRDYLTPDDVKARAQMVLGHRLRLARGAVLKGSKAGPSDVIADVLRQVEPPK